MKNNFPYIYKNSANLFNVLSTCFGRTLSPKIESAFKYCIENDGLNEIDFIRPEGQSYNPRPARVALILINDCEQHDQELIISAILACSRLSNDKKANNALEICNYPSDNKNYQREEKLIALALHLDRARHFHLSPKYQESKLEFHKLTKRILDIAGTECKKTTHLILHWLQRDERKN